MKKILTVAVILAASSGAGSAAPLESGVRKARAAAEHRPKAEKSELCVPTRLEVRKGAPKGSQEVFPTLKGALAQARDACRLDLALDEGEYRENLAITADTAIRAKGAASPVIQGRIENLSGRFLLLDGVAVSGAKGKGIEQNGGRLFMRKVQVKGTEATSDIASGRGVTVRGGAKALLMDVKLEGNAGGGLLAKDEGTVVHAAGLDVRDNKVLAAATARYASTRRAELLGAVESASRAFFFGDKLEVHGNQGVGINLMDQARAHIRNLNVSGTMSTIEDPAVSDGNNMFVGGGSMLELFNFTSSRSQKGGLSIAKSMVRAQHGKIEDNAVGIQLEDPAPGFDLNKCFDDVTNFGNEADYSPSVFIPSVDCAVPGTPGCGDAQGKCPGVPWEPAPVFP